MLLNHRYLIHRVKNRLGTENLIHKLYFDKNWKEYGKEFDAVHLLVNHRSYLDPKSPIKEFNETNIRDYEFSFGRIARDILLRSNVII
jgi:hypothetical protein